MFNDSPLHSIVVPGENKKKRHNHRRDENIDREKEGDNEEVDPFLMSVVPPSRHEATKGGGGTSVPAVEDTTSFEESVFVSDGKSSTKAKTPFEEKLGAIGNDDDIDFSEYPDSGVIRERLDPDEGSHLPKELTKNHPPGQEPEGLKASKQISMIASGDDPTFLDKVKDAVKGKESDPPASPLIASPGGSIAASSYGKKDSGDPPAFKREKSFPDDENCEKDTLSGPAEDSFNDMAGGVTAIIVDDDDDSFTHGNKITNDVVLTIEDKKDDDTSVGKELAVRSDDDASHGKELAIRSKDEAVTDLVVAENKSEESVEYAGEKDVSVTENTQTSDASSAAGAELLNEMGASEYLNIRSDGMIVVKAAPAQTELPPPPPKSANLHSYYDVHKAAYKDSKARLNELSELVEYVQQWEQTVTNRVKSRYFEYAKHRNSLNHYAKKMEQLLHEEERLREKGRAIKPKQKEKMERNEHKLTGSRETHDSAGESLLMLLDEVLVRSWKDAYPLLNKSIRCEVDYAAIQQKHMSNLGATLEALDGIGQKKSVSMDGRLDQFQKNPEDLYTGAGLSFIRSSSTGSA